MNENAKDRLLELLIDDALSGLSKEESVELNQLKSQFPQWENDLSFELTAAAIGLSGLDAAREMPANLRAKILDDADKYFSDAPQKSSNVVRDFPVKTPLADTSRNRAIGNLAEETRTKTSFLQWLGWGIAAAACVALAFNIWQNNSRPPVTETVKTVEVVKTPTPELPAAQQREQLIATATDVVQIEWKSPTDEKRVLGDIVWSNERQKGFLRLRGLPANDPQRETYQFWIVDDAQNPKTPVDGGVFDIASGGGGEVVVPIDAKLKIKKPKSFALTKEKPGGVVVSKLAEVVAVAKI